MCTCNPSCGHDRQPTVQSDHYRPHEAAEQVLHGVSAEKVLGVIQYHSPGHSLFFRGPLPHFAASETISKEGPCADKRLSGGGQPMVNHFPRNKKRDTLSLSQDYPPRAPQTAACRCRPDIGYCTCNPGREHQQPPRTTHHVAERVEFEPAARFRVTGFQGQLHTPLVLFPEYFA